MPWEEVKREDAFQGSDKPFISISPDHISFNAVFTRIAELDPGKYVKFHVDADNLKIGFTFLNKQEPHSWKLTPQSASRGKQRQGLFCAGMGFVPKYPWLMAVAKLRDVTDRRFEPTREGGRWVIQSCPAFETKAPRESSEDIPSDLCGIYRYVRESGEVVYIGRGNIRQRLTEPVRKDWDFDVIEYSRLDNPNNQLTWETYWIDRHEEQNGKRPFYNKISGIDKVSEECALR